MSSRVQRYKVTESIVEALRSGDADSLPGLAYAAGEEVLVTGDALAAFRDRFLCSLQSYLEIVQVVGEDAIEPLRNQVDYRIHQLARLYTCLASLAYYNEQQFPAMSIYFRTYDPDDFEEGFPPPAYVVFQDLSAIADIDAPSPILENFLDELASNEWPDSITAVMEDVEKESILYSVAVDIAMRTRCLTIINLESKEDEK